MANVIISTHWLDGDVLPFMRIGRALKQRGHQVTIITHCYFKCTAEKYNLNFEPWDTQEEYELLLKFMDGGLSSSPENEKLREFRENFESIPVRLKEYEKVLKYCNNDNTVIIAKCRSSIGAFLAAEKMRLPLVTVFMNPTEPVSMSTYNEIYGINELQQLNNLRLEVGLEPISSWIHWHTSSKLFIGLWPSWFTNNEDLNWPTEILCVGFPIECQNNFHEVSSEIQEIIDGEIPPIIISGGTTKMLSPLFYPTSVEACGLMGIPTILLTRYKDLVPEKLPPNIKWCEYLPLDEVLSKCQIIIHHGGIGTSSGALKNGVPQLVLPYFGDGLFNGRHLKKLGVAECLPVIRWKAEYIKMSLEKLTQIEYQHTCKQYKEQIEKENAIEKVCLYVESMIGNHDYVFEINK